MKKYTLPLGTQIKEIGKWWVLIFLLLILFLGADIFPEYATDTYALINDGFSQYASSIFLHANGRVVAAIVYYIADWLELTINQFYIFNFLLAMVSLLIAILVLAKDIHKLLCHELASILIAFVILMNPLIIEYFMFIEVGITMLAVMFCVVATHLFIEYLKTHKRTKFIFSLLCTIISAFSYQAVTALFVVLSAMFLFFYQRKPWKYIANLVRIGTIYAISMGSNFVYLRTAQSGFQRAALHFDSLFNNLLNSFYSGLHTFISMLNNLGSFEPPVRAS